MSDILLGSVHQNIRFNYITSIAVNPLTNTLNVRFSFHQSAQNLGLPPLLSFVLDKVENDGPSSQMMTFGCEYSHLHDSLCPSLDVSVGLNINTICPSFRLFVLEITSLIKTTAGWQLI